MDATPRRTPGPTPGPTPEERADLLLGGPLGRQYLAGYVDSDLENRLFRELGLGDVPGVALVEVTLTGAGPGRVRQVRRRARRGWREVPADEVRAVVRDAVAEGEWNQLGALTEEEALEELAGTSETFGFGGGDEAHWGLTAIAAAELHPVAEALARSPAASRWWEPIHRPDQRQLSWNGDVGLAGVADAVRRDMDAERRANRGGLRRRPRKGERNLGATWWSAPDFAENTWTTGARPGLPTIELAHFVDTFTPLEPATGRVSALTVDEAARVAEIRRPEDWRDLVARYPRDATGTHDGEWRNWGDVDGPWYLPDWEALAEDLDGVHVTVGGYLATCGLALPVRDGYTMLAGWVPDATVWVRDTATALRTLGHWRGEPHNVADWDEVRAGWTPTR